MKSFKKISEIAKKLNLNRSYLYKIFKEETDYSLKDYLIQIRMEKSADLLTRTTFHISEIANAVGFPDALAFQQGFQKTFPDKAQAITEKHNNKTKSVRYFLPNVFYDTKIPQNVSKIDHLVTDSGISEDAKEKFGQLTDIMVADE